ncbi:calcium-dependent phosphotriesterase [Violaceomyces palustris]|uniref:Calcium-dependent phosphotriesterase n=1 Tax=Violaceomyces palustris TaxID=1673888 RepID=A0ACD0P2Q2_9BASI|nr:calcium-dependent phosphotriesterase [Violaceomyces palustris]
MASKILPFLALPALLLAVAYQFFTGKGTWIHDGLGIGRQLESINNKNCIKVPELQACEHMWMHRPSGLLYLACSDPIGRVHWTPAVDNLDLQGRPTTDYFAILDTKAQGPISSRIKKISPSLYHDSLNVHGFDVHVVPTASSEIKPTLRIFAVNHRPPIDPLTHTALDPHKVGANSTVELFETTLGESKMRHIRTYAFPEIRTPNMPAAVGPDSFLVTNDHLRKVGHARILELFKASSDIAYCDTQGCRVAISPLAFPNGIIRSPNQPNTFFAASSVEAKIRVLELQADKSLVLIDEIRTGYPADNLSVDSQGRVYVAVFPKILHTSAQHFPDPVHVHTPSAVLRISPNEAQSRFFGEKYKVEKIFEDDGENASGVTVGLFDEEEDKLYLGGVSQPFTAICQL